MLFLAGDLTQWHLPVGMKDLNLRKTEVTGTLVTMPPSMKEFNIMNTGVKIDVAAIEWPANATALAYEYLEEDEEEDYYGDWDVSRYGTLVCRTTDPDESKEGAETSELRILCEQSQVIGTSSAWRVINT